MNLTVATNWDPPLADELCGIDQVKELFGVLQRTPVGSGRPYFIIADPSPEEAAAYIEGVHARGRKFNYLLNGPCMNNMEYDRAVHRQLIDHIHWLRDIGVDSLTVTIPYLLEIVKRQFPDMETRVSVIAHVNSVQRARLFESLGADAITLDVNINRDFKLLEKIRRAVKCRLGLIVNDPCLYQCPFRTYHYNLLAHSTQPYNPLEGFYIDYCIVRCTIEKYSHPVEIIRSRWIRPEDLHLYQDLGIDAFKISGRRMSTRWLLNAANAYAARGYEGNLFDLLNCVTPGVDVDAHSPQYQTFLKQSEFLKREKLIQLGQLYPVKPHIDNRGLDGFIDFFKEKACLSSCAECRYCQQVAEKVIQLDPAEAAPYIAALKELLDDLTTGRIFEEPDGAATKAGDDGLPWNRDVEAVFDRLIRHTPEMFRDIARQTVKRQAEINAQERQSSLVEEGDMVRAFLSETPQPFQADMISALQEGGIPLDDYR
jgi:collagenase-like PrtC family protease